MKISEVVPILNESDRKRFWAKVRRGDGCWEWTAARTKRTSGYGVFGIRSAGLVLAHRLSMILAGIEVPDDACVLHHCDNPSCVRPSHLFIGSKMDNSMDALAKGRLAPNRRLTQEQADQVREYYSRGIRGRGRVSTAHRFGIARTTVDLILRGETYKGVRNVSA